MPTPSGTKATILTREGDVIEIDTYPHGTDAIWLAAEDSEGNEVLIPLTPRKAREIAHELKTAAREVKRARKSIRSRH